jgi:hypothetical protein
VRQVACLRHGTPHRVVVVLQQRIQVVDERLYFCGVAALEPRIAAFVHGAQFLAELSDTGEPASDLEHAGGHEHERNGERQPGVVPHEMDVAVAAEDRHIRHVPEDQRD